jgi:Ca2+-binding EF-hand superfamily protein
VVEIIFNIFDNNNQGNFSFTNFINYLNSYGLLNNEDMNPDLLYIRFDKKRNGRIDFEEFVDELEPL